MDTDEREEKVSIMAALCLPAALAARSGRPYEAAIGHAERLLETLEGHFAKERETRKQAREDESKS